MGDSTLGRARIDLTRGVVAGSHVTLRLTYVAGKYGIDDSGSVKIVQRFATDAGTPQFDDPGAPNYVTARTTSRARTLLRYDAKANTRPWGRTLYVKIVGGYLREGDELTVTYGDRSNGSPGWRAQTFCEDTLEFKVLVDRFATCAYEEVPESPTIRIVAGPAVRLVAVAPTMARVGERVLVRFRADDQWGNPVGKPRARRFPGFPAQGTYTIAVRDARRGLECETNPIVVRKDVPLGRYWADLHGQSEETIGSNTIDDYFAFGRDKAFLDICAHQGNDFQVTDSFWRKVNQATREFYDPGRFVTFPGYEWSGNTGMGGDRNVYYKSEGRPISRSCRALIPRGEASFPDSAAVEELFSVVREQGGMTFAHVGGRWADLARHEEGVEVGVEVHSAWGTAEWLLADALAQGHRMAIVANSDGHKGRPGASHPGASHFGSYGGLTCVLAERLDRDAVWAAYQARHVYATTGARIFLDVRTANGALMGDVVQAEGPVTLRAHVAGTAPIERVELRNGMKTVRTFRPYSKGDPGNRIKVAWQGAEYRGRGRHVTWDGELRVTGNRIRRITPVNFLNRLKPCRLASPRRVAWESVTTGALAGVIAELEHRDRGTIEVNTAQKRFRLALDRIGLSPRRYRAGGLGKSIEVYRLPTVNRAREMAFECRVSRFHPGDNPLHFHVVQEDGHRAWSSPIYVVVQ